MPSSNEYKIELNSKKVNNKETKTVTLFDLVAK